MGQTIDVSRFSMCNCITVQMPDCYTAHAMSCSYFLRPDVVPGAELLLPHTNLWPSGYIRKFKIPRKIKTFLFSSFNEAFNPSYLIDGMGTTHFALGPHTGLKELREMYATPIPRPTDDEWVNWLINMDYKIGKMWGHVRKIIVEYDNTISGCTTKVRLDHYDDITRNVLKWPVARVVQSEPFEKRWMHYNKSSLNNLYNKIKEIEARTVNSR